jgi:type I restriction enzyme R subunit
MVAVVRFDQETTAKVKNPGASNDYPKSLNSNAKRALYYNLGQDEELALAVDMEIVGTKRDASRKNGSVFRLRVFMGFV